MNILNSTLIAISKFTDDVSEFTFKLEWKMDLIPGQFVMMDIDNGSEKRITRAYSVKSYDGQSDELGLCIKNVNWVWTSWIFGLWLWDKVVFSWPFGHFTLRCHKDILYFFATWIWMPPIIYFLNDLFWKWTNKTVRLIFWVRCESDIYYEDYLKELSKKHTNFSYEICLSREWKKWYYHWYITKKIFEENVDWSNAEWYYCGSVPILKDLKEKLIGLWMDKKSFFKEAF